ncbi:MAG: UDP-glucose/GDP-mannose dehydrogenase family protein [Verrucomicrobia bacterium]|nr:UDP-glucose/GDP-mannose dehydrogenase family protein [Verrucomicrobiota bacterium]
MNDIVVVGMGYVGLVTATGFAEMGYTVCGLDKNHERITSLRQGRVPIFEPGLEEKMKRAVKAGHLRFTTDYKDALSQARVCFLAVDTPVTRGGGCDLTSVENAARQIAQEMSGYLLIVNKSTVPVGTTARVREIIAGVLEERNCQFSFDVVSNPEFLKEGAAVADFMKPDRVIIGADNERAANLMRELYRPFMLAGERVFVMDPASAELTKYAANTMLALRISFMNWLSQLCEATGANILDIRKGLGSDRRIGNEFLWAGAGFGGSCFPKDIKALKAIAEELGISASIIDSIEEINTRQKETLGNKIIEYFGAKEGVSGKTIGILGLAFKPETDDMREAPSLVLIDQLLKAGANVRLFDPEAQNNAQKILGAHPQISWCIDAADTARGAHALALVTEWKQFRQLDFKSLQTVMQEAAFFDGRNQYEPQEMARLGFDYFSIGRSPALACVDDILV